LQILRRFFSGNLLGYPPHPAHVRKIQ
jgi:hypothetical protein